MRRTTLRICLALGLLWAGSSRGLAQQALEDLEKQLPIPTAGSQVGAPKGADPAGEEPGYLGIYANESGDGRGVRLTDVMPGGPADTAGMRVGDVLTSIDGGGVNSLDQLADSLARRAVGEQLAMVVIRGVDALRFDVVLGKRPPPGERRYPAFGRITDQGGEPIVVEPPTNALPAAPPAPGAVVGPTDTLPPPQGPVLSTVPQPGPGELGPRQRTGSLGVRVVRVTPELQLAMNLPEARGALIVEVRPDSPARKAGLPVDAVIVAANGRRVEGPDELAAIVSEIAEGGSLRVTYYRYGQSFERVVALSAPAGAALTAPPVDAPPAISEIQSPPSVVTAPPAGPSPAAAPPAAVPAAPAPRSVTDENERLKARIAELEAQLKAKEAGKP